MRTFGIIELHVIEAQLYTFKRSDWRADGSFLNFNEIYALSTKKTMLVFRSWTICNIRIKKITGPKIVPCGIPLVTGYR